MSNIVWSPAKGWHDGPEVSVTETPRLRMPSSALAQLHRVHNAPTKKREPRYGSCSSCGAIEVKLRAVIGFKDLSSIGESSAYPVGYGCELCS